MIIDKIENLKNYARLNEGLAIAIDFLNRTDLSQLDLGTHKINGDQVFAMVQEYETKKIDECKLEGHFKHIDIQYLIRGEESIGLALKSNQEVIEKNDEGDYAFFNGSAVLHEFNSSVFGIFFPDDLHMPGITLKQTSKVKKVVVKIRL